MRFAIGLALVVFAWSAPAHAGTLELLSDDRFVNAFGEFCTDDGGGFMCDPFEDVTETPSPAFSSFNDSVSAGDGGFASQTSAAGTESLSGVGFASGFSELGYGIGSSVYDVTFRLHGPTLVDLTGTLTAFDTQGFGFAESEVRLSEGATVLFTTFADPFDTLVPFSFSDELPAGDYRLYLQADGDVSMEGSFDFTLTAVATVPAVTLHGLNGLTLALGFGGARRLQRQRGAPASV